MNRGLGIARCGLACCLCSESDHCRGCNSGDCPDKDWCENRNCSRQRGLNGCYECTETECRKGLLQKIKPYAFVRYIRLHSISALMDCLERNEKNGVVYHRSGITGDYDDFTDVDELLAFIETGTVKK